jgi:hypothetical protein
MRRTVTLASVLVLALVVVWSVATEAQALPEGRVYEMVSPVYKGGYGAGTVEAVAQDGERVGFLSKGAFAGAPTGATLSMDYVAHRDPRSGWLTHAVAAPANLMPYVPPFTNYDTTPSLERVFALGENGQNYEASANLGNQAEFWLHDTDLEDVVAAWEKDGSSIKEFEGETPFTATYAGASLDLCHLFVSDINVPLVETATESKKPRSLVYEVDSGCAGHTPATRVVGVNNSGGLIRPSCGAELGTGFFGANTDSTFNAVSAGGREVFFTAGVQEQKGVCEQTRHQLFARLDGERTLEISIPVAESEACTEVPCSGAASRGAADFAGASSDGSRVWFTSAASLVPGADASTNLYVASIGCASNRTGEACTAANEIGVASLAQASRPLHSGEAAEVQAVVRVAPDGSRAYFVARGLLSAANSRGEAPAAGADNLYVYDAQSHETTFVAELCSGPDVSGPGGATQGGAVEDRQCPADLQAQALARNDTKLWLSNIGEAQTADSSGRFLVFSSYGQLTSDDTDSARDVYRYDAEDQGLTRVSIGERGFDANGNNDNFDASVLPGHWGGDGDYLLFVYELDNRAATTDGSRIVFTTSDPLSPGAVNGLENAYEWRQNGDGTDDVSLVSGGGAEEPVFDVTIAPEGRDIVFVTTQGLVPQDVDGAPDVYDARLRGGFPAPPRAPQPCSGDACQGPLTNPASLLVPGSVVQAAGENIAPAKATRKKHARSQHRKKPKTRRRHAKRKAQGSSCGCKKRARGSQ